jgi:hypothetical protein
MNPHTRMNLTIQLVTDRGRARAAPGPLVGYPQSSMDPWGASGGPETTDGSPIPRIREDSRS